MEVWLHAHKVDCVIFKAEIVGPVCIRAATTWMDDTMDVAPPAPQRVHYYTDIIYLYFY